MTQLTIDDLVNREVNCCLSALVSTLASGYGDGLGSRNESGIVDLCEQAFELASPIDDWEEAARQDGWTLGGVELDRCMVFTKGDEVVRETTWGELCDEQGLDPYKREVFEHWSVSPWLARQLEAKGERVDMDFAGLTVWARTTSGQGIASDSVIVAIYNEMMAPKVEASR